MTVPFSQVKPASIKMKVLPRFPANIVGGTGIAATKQNGVVTIDLALSKFAPPASALTDSANQNALLWNQNTGVYTLAPVSLVGAAGAGLADAPINGIAYVRQSGAWAPSPNFDALSPTTTRGDLIFRNATTNTRLGAGTAGYFLQSNGAGADPSYAGFTAAGTGVTRTMQDKTRDIVSVKDFGAVGDNATDDAAAFNAAFAAGKYIIAPSGLPYYINAPVTVPANVTIEFLDGTSYRLGPSGTWTNNGSVIGTEFTGLGSIHTRVQRGGSAAIYNSTDLSPVNLFNGVFQVISNEDNNGIVGSITNHAPAGTPRFPTGVTGYGVNFSSGGSVFGIFGRADAKTAGCVTNELNTFNFFGPPPGTYPPDRGFGITAAQPITLTIAAGGTFTSAIGIQIAKEGSQPQQYLTGIYTNPDAVFSFGIFVDANASQGPVNSALFKNVGAFSTSTCLSLQITGTAVAGAKLIDCVGPSGGALFSVDTNGILGFPNANVASSATAGASGALPATPANYLKILVNGVTMKIPYYNS